MAQSVIAILHPHMVIWLSSSVSVVVGVALGVALSMIVCRTVCHTLACRCDPEHHEEDASENDEP